MSSDLKTVRYRIYYQDSANSWGTGEPPLFDGRSYDLAVLCIASDDKAPGQPESILTRLRPYHVLVTHYDEIFPSPESSGALRRSPHRGQSRSLPAEDLRSARLRRRLRRAGQPRLRPVRTPLDDAAARRSGCGFRRIQNRFQ